MRFPYGQTATIERPTFTEDRRTNKVIDGWETVGTLKVAFAPSNMGELRDMGREGTHDEPRLYVQGKPVIGKDDTIVIDGERFEVEGNPETWRFVFTGRETNTVIKLRRVDG